MMEQLSPAEREKIAEDVVQESYDRFSVFQRATMLFILNRNGWTFDRALAVRRKGVDGVT